MAVETILSTWAKQVGALAGLPLTPYQSGQARRELGIANAGNRHIRAMAIEIARALAPLPACQRPGPMV
jgi:transposase